MDPTELLVLQRNSNILFSQLSMSMIQNVQVARRWELKRKFLSNSSNSLARFLEDEYNLKCSFVETIFATWIIMCVFKGIAQILF